MAENLLYAVRLAWLFLWGEGRDAAGSVAWVKGCGRDDPFSRCATDPPKGEPGGRTLSKGIPRKGERALVAENGRITNAIHLLFERMGGSFEDFSSHVYL